METTDTASSAPPAAPVLTPRQRSALLDALRRGTVPKNNLETLAVGLEKFEPTMIGEFEEVADGQSKFKAVQGAYGAGKTFFIRRMQQLARDRGFATAEVQISKKTTPQRFETIYQKLIENLSIEGESSGALKSIIDSWFYALDEEAGSAWKDEGEPSDEWVLEETNKLMEIRLQGVSKKAPEFAACLRGYREALAEGDRQRASSLIAWLSGMPSVAASVKKSVDIKGDVTHAMAQRFVRGLLTILTDSGHAGLVLVLDEVELLQRAAGNIRNDALEALRQLMDEIDQELFPGLYLMVTGTPAFYEGQNGVSRVEALEQRLKVDFDTDARFDNPRAVRIRLAGFDTERLLKVGVRVRDVYAHGSSDSVRIHRMADDAYLESLARAVCGKLGDKVGIAPRLFLKKLVGDVLDRIDQFPDFDPRKDYRLTIVSEEMTELERNAVAGGVDDIDIDLPEGKD